MSISWLLTNMVSLLLRPPACLVRLAAAGDWIARQHPRTGRGLVIAAVALLYLLATPLLSTELLSSLEAGFTPPAEKGGADAIVLLGGGRYRAAPEYDSRDTVSISSLMRGRYAAQLHKRTGTPILASGGKPDGGTLSEAVAMTHLLEKEFGIPVRWQESLSNNTIDQARQCHMMLAPLGHRKIYLVTQAWHMRRAVLAFETAGFEVTPAPTGFTSLGPLNPLHFLPTGYGVMHSSLAIHEYTSG
jgi:uncharacterized SAM-binding protein YcdF (DUF218 family)